MDTNKKALLFAALSALFLAGASVTPALAGPRGRAARAHTNARQHRQRQRAREGMRSGEVTGGEAQRLRREQRLIERGKRRALSDGELSRSEKRRLQRAQDKASRDIYRVKHNERVREGASDAASADAAPEGQVRPRAARLRGEVRQRLQRRRIQQGVRSGELTPEEGRRLRREQRLIERGKRRALSDGEMGPGEKRLMERAQDAASADIHRQKHDEEERQQGASD